MILNMRLAVFMMLRMAPDWQLVFPAWMKYTLRHDLNRFVQWAVRVWNVELDVFDREATAREGIRRMEEFFRTSGLGTGWPIWASRKIACKKWLKSAPPGIHTRLEIS